MTGVTVKVTVVPEVKLAGTGTATTVISFEDVLATTSMPMPVAPSTTGRPAD
jgi:hypothetical protein